MPERVGRVLGLSSLVAIVAALIFAIGYFITCPFIVSSDYVGRIRIGAICIFFTGLRVTGRGLCGFELPKNCMHKCNDCLPESGRHGCIDARISALLER